MPTFTASAPASMRSAAPSAGGHVAGDHVDVEALLIFLTVSMTFSLWPWAESTTMTSTSVGDQGLDPVIVVHADGRPHPQPPAGVLASSWGTAGCLSMSRMVIMPASRPSGCSSSSFSTLCWLRIFSGLSSVVSGGAVTRFFLVITSSIGRLSVPARNFSPGG